MKEKRCFSFVQTFLGIHFQIGSPIKQAMTVKDRITAF